MLHHPAIYINWCKRPSIENMQITDMQLPFYQAIKMYTDRLVYENSVNSHQQTVKRMWYTSVYQQIEQSLQENTPLQSAHLFSIADDLTSSSTVAPVGLTFISQRCSELSVQNVTSRPCFINSTVLSTMTIHDDYLLRVKYANLVKKHGSTAIFYIVIMAIIYWKLTVA